jgi:site-specific recombinase XerD
MKTLLKRCQAENIDEISTELLQELFYEGREKYQWSYWHYVNHYKYLKKFLDWCVLRGYIKRNPIIDIKKPKKPQTLPRRLTYEQAQRILYASFNHDWCYVFERSRNHAIIAVFLFTGLRAQELLDLQIVDVNLESGVLLVREGKGGKDRYVPIHHKLGYILKRYLADRKRLKKQSLYLFVGARSDFPLNYKDVNKICGKISRACGVKFTPHCLRHTFGSVAIEQDMGLVQLKEIMGHSNIASTMIYLKMSPKGLKDSLNRLELF